MIVHAIGEWRVLLDREGKPLDTNVGNDWKNSYHTGRAMCECQMRLRKLLKQS
jgi:mannose/cellobiose epimerase-like protein (N-acyl-D-glucosamine 2-epimerase family)